MKNATLRTLIAIGSIGILLTGGCAKKHIETFSSGDGQKDCRQVIESLSDNSEAMEDVLDKDIDLFQIQFEQLLSFTEVSRSIFERAGKLAETDLPIPPTELEQVIATVGQSVALVQPVKLILGVCRI